MRNYILSSITAPLSISFGLLAFGFVALRSRDLSLKGVPRREERPGAEGSMQISSPAFGHLENIPQKYTCDGGNVAPELNVSSVPAEAQSLVLIVHDNDAPIEGGWTHWTIFNLDPSTSKIISGQLPQGAIEAQTNFGQSGYGGPCPPSGTHHYEFSLYALDSRLSLDQNANELDIEHAMEDHIIAKSVLIGLYQRSH